MGGGFSTHGRGEERAEGGGFLGKLGDESPRDGGVEGGWDMEISHTGRVAAGLAVQQQWKTAHAAARSIRVRHQEDMSRVPGEMWASL